VTLLSKAEHHLRLYINGQWGDEEKYIMQNMEGVDTVTRGGFMEGNQEE
jgi:hypothetical protein